MKILDTNIISLAMRGSFPHDVAGQTISSVTAHEFLKSYSLDTSKARYYVPTPSRLRTHTHDALVSHRSHGISKRVTDQLILDLGRGLPSVIEFGSFAIAEIINKRMYDVYRYSVRHLPRAMQRTVLGRFRYLLDSKLRCVPLTRPFVEAALSLLSRFLDEHEPKGNLRNTINDMLILGTALTKDATLLTEDSLLSRFAAERAEVGITPHSAYVSIPFSAGRAQARRTLRESKGYVNRGWQVRTRHMPSRW